MEGYEQNMDLFEERFQRRLRTLGRLLASVRDLDWKLDDDGMIAMHVDRFFRMENGGK